MTAASRRFTLLTSLTLAAALLAGCAPVTGVGGQGGMTDPEPSVPESSQNGEAPDGSPNESQTAPAAGRVEVKLERTETDQSPRLFTFEATECQVSQERISVVAAGVEEGAGTTAQLTVDTVFGELLHSGTQTITAKGEIVLTLGDGQRWVSDGRLDDRFGVMLPSMFEYRVDGGYGEFRTAWFEDAGARESGFVHVYCARP